MPTYRQRPIEIEAMRYDGNNLEEVQAFTGTRLIESTGETVPVFTPMGTYLPAPPGALAGGELWVHELQVIVQVGTNRWIVKNNFGFTVMLDQQFQDAYMTDPNADNDFTYIGEQCFASPDDNVISWKGANYYKACDAFVAELPEGGQTHCVKRVGHIPPNVHEDYSGNTRAEASQVGQLDI